MWAFREQLETRAHDDAALPVKSAGAAVGIWGQVDHTTRIVIAERGEESPRYQARCACRWLGEEVRELVQADAEAAEHRRSSVR
jgi:hypothetical protein